MVRITRNESHYDESSPDIPSGYGVEQHPRDGWYAYRVAEFPGLSIAYLKDAQGLNRVFASREAAVAALHAVFMTAFFAIVAMWAAITTDILSEEMDDPANYQAWLVAIDAYGERMKAVPVHTPEHRFCLMSDCPCHDGEEVL